MTTSTGLAELTGMNVVTAVAVNTAGWGALIHCGRFAMAVGALQLLVCAV